MTTQNYLFLLIKCLYSDIKKKKMFFSPSRCVKRFSGSMPAIRVELGTNLLTPRRNIHEICVSGFLCVKAKNLQCLASNFFLSLQA